MDDERWERLRAHLARARSNPDFDSEERAFRLEIAGELRDMIRIAGERGPWTDRLQAIVTGLFANRRYELTERSHNRWLRNIADPEQLGLALACFADSAADPADRFSRFVEAAARQQPQLLVTPTEYTGPHPDRDAVLTFGALLNFACAPAELPAMHLELWNLLEQTLGYEWSFRRSPAEQYRFHLAFAAAVDRRLRGAGIEIRDMLDTQSLIHIAGAQADFWMADRAKRRDRAAARTKHALTVCAIYRDEADYLAEWVEFHRLAGAERFFLYNNFSADNHREVLAPYVEEGLVIVRDWPVLDGRVGQIAAYNDYLRWNREESHWTAFIDLDEFLFSPGGEPLPEVLASYAEWPALAVRWAMFGSSGHKKKPAGLVTENYRRRIPFDGAINMKTIADASRTTTCLSAHHFDYPYLSAVDENEFPVPGTRTSSGSVARLRLNHYHWKSEEEYVAKCARMRAIGRPREVPGPEHFEWLRAAEEMGETDDAIQHYVPALKEALAARDALPA